MTHQSAIKQPVNTYSIVARDPKTGQLGVAVQSHYFSVGSVVPWAEAGVGAVATQSFVLVDYGPEGVERMRNGMSAPEALKALLARDEERDVRQVAMIDTQGNVAAHTGKRCIAAAGHLIDDNVSVQANLMVDESVWPAMMHAYQNSTGDLASRLVAALEAAEAAGGDIRGKQSAALLVVAGERQKKPWQGRLIELRVEDHPHPVQELKRLVQRRCAYQLVNRSRELMALKRFEEASQLLTQGLALAPELTELKFWAGLDSLIAGQEEQGQELLKSVLAQEPIWKTVLPRLVKGGRLTEELYQQILAVQENGSSNGLELELDALLSPA